MDTAWFGVEECATLAFDSHDRIVALCGDLEGPTLRVLDPDSMRPIVTKDLPDRVDVEGKKPWENLCGGAYFYLDERRPGHGRDHRPPDPRPSRPPTPTATPT